MKNLKCPQCDIHRFVVKNESGESIVVTVNKHYEVIPVHAGVSLAGYDLNLLYCLGCSWQGAPELLRNGSHK